MLAIDLISDSIPSIKTSDPARKVLDWMNEFKVAQLPVVNNEELLGIVQEEDLLETENAENPIGNVMLSLPENTLVYDESHFFDALRLMADHKLDIIPVISARDGHYCGILTKTDVLEHAGKFLNVNESGGLIVLEVASNSYALSEIARLCEGEDAKILSLGVTPTADYGAVRVTIKLNVRELSRIIATFQRFEYKIVQVVFDAEQLDDYRENYENFLRYLEI